MPINLELKNISKSFGSNLANQNISLSVKEGEIQALLGENGAGKSTLVKIIYGILKPDEGEIYWKNQLIKKNNPDEAKKLGIHMIFQHFSLFDSFTIAQNIALSISGKINFVNLIKEIESVSKKYGLALDPNKLVLNLSPSDKQRIEIVRSLIQTPKLLIMDEPTSVLNPLEIQSLFKFLKKLRDEGCSILYISHKLDEIIELCDRAVILRQGKLVTECNPKKETKKSLAELMIGKKIIKIKKAKIKKKNANFFQVNNLSVNLPDATQNIKNISFTVANKEIFAIAGISANGQQTLQECLCGLRLTENAEQITLDGEPLGHLDLSSRRERNLIFVSDERLGTSAVPEMSLAQNTFLTGYMIFDDYLKNKLINFPKISADAEKIIQDFNVKTTGNSALAGDLSGGNLQKFIIGREIYTNPKLLVVANPTWGIDVGAAKLIHQTLLDLVEKGTSIILISQDLDEIYAISDKVAAICGGRLSPSYHISEVDINKMGLLIGGSF